MKAIRQENVKQKIMAILGEKVKVREDKIDTMRNKVNKNMLFNCMLQLAEGVMQKDKKIIV